MNRVEMSSDRRARVRAESQEEDLCQIGRVAVVGSEWGQQGRQVILHSLKTEPAGALAVGCEHRRWCQGLFSEQLIK